MHYTVDYSKFPEWEAKINALKDAEDWLGKPRFRKVVKLLKNDNTSSKRMLYLALAMLGIQGYPAQAMIEVYARKQLELVFE